MEQNKPGSSEMEVNRHHLKGLTEIRSLMERSSSFISLSGLSGISAGIMGLIAAFILHQKLFRFMDYSKSPMISAEARQDFIIFGILVSAGVLIVTFIAAIFFTARKAKKNGFLL